MVPVIAFVGRHNSGKTTLLTKVIKELNSQNVKVGVIKHAHHQLEIPNTKDSEKLFNAGATVVCTNSLDIQIVYSRTEAKALNEIIKTIETQVDVIILEGYKEEPYPKIEVMRQEINQEPLQISNVIARVLDFNLETEIKVKEFNFEEIRGICQFIFDYISSYYNS